MSNKIIEVEPGNSINLEKILDLNWEQYQKVNDKDVLKALLNIPLLVRALQQREEREQRAVSELRIAAHSTNDQAQDVIYRVIDILEGK